MTIQLKTIALWWQRSPGDRHSAKAAKKKNADRAKEQLSKLGHEASARPKFQLFRHNPFTSAAISLRSGERS
jgi:hypothetical protein